MTDIAFAIGEVAAMLGVSPHTIRAWERRHLVVRPQRTITGQRRYTYDDIELLRQMKHERHVHGFTMRMAALAAQGVVVPDTAVPDAAGVAPLDVAAIADAGDDPLRMVADLVSEVVLVIDGGGRIVHANTAFVRFSGALLGQLRGAAFLDFVDPFDRAKAVQVYQSPMRQRRGWELSLRAPRQELLYSFDCWPVASGDGPMLVLIGRDVPSGGSAPEVGGQLAGDEAPAEERAGAGFGRPGAAPQLSALLDGVADPLRTLGLVRHWLDRIQEGVVLTRADAPLTVLFANRAFGAMIPARRLPVEGQPWHAVAADTQGGRLAIEATEAIRSEQPRAIFGLRLAGPDDGDAIWDVHLCPVIRVAGGVSHLVLVVADVTAEAAAARRLDALMACAPAMREPGEPQELLHQAAPHALHLLPNAGSLLALSDPDSGVVRVVATSGACARDGEGAGPQMLLALLRDAVRTRTSIEVERAGGEREPVETFRIVPLVASSPPRRAGEALGALAFLRAGSSSFSAEDRQLIDELAGRLGLALAHRWPG
ncbi:MAG TPA: MerR family transcriptional regulator [Candidatus Dormibacteraeota bacterium]|nr:MerR family transcriptional regulator [Candidatus Dormibacteraeota bacterium]